MAVERHVARVAERLPAEVAAFRPATDASDAVILHLWQAVQIVIDLALAACLHLRLGTPASYADAFARLAAAGVLDDALAERLVRAAGFRNVVAHAYERLDMERVHRAAREGPGDLRRFLGALRDRI
jgi:uncharacterized protein YutE (UPF0331/DUF86 family)